MATEIVKIIDPDGTGDYTSLAAWESAMQKDLVTADEISVAKCRCTGGSANTGQVVIDGWTTDATRYIKIWTDPSEGYRHLGKWTTGNYFRVEFSSAGSGTSAIDLREEYVRVHGIQIKQTTTAAVNQYALITRVTAGGSYYQLADCILWGVQTAGTLYGINANDTDITSMDIWNCVAYGFNGAGYLGYRTNIYNSTFYNCGGQGIRDLGNECVVKNCAVFNNADDFYGTFSLISNCASDDGDGTNPVTPSNWNTVFTDAANGDFHLLSTGTELIGAGLNDPGSGLYSNDIDGVARTTTWDIGADEYVAVGGGGKPYYAYAQQ